MDQRNENHEKNETESNTGEVDLKERYKIEKCVEIAGSIQPQTGLRRPSRQPGGLRRVLRQGEHCC